MTCDVRRVTCDVDAHRSLEVAGSVLWDTIGAVKQLFGVESSLQEEKLPKQHNQQQHHQQQQQQQLVSLNKPPPASVTTRLDRHATASLYMRVSAAAAGLPSSASLGLLPILCNAPAALRAGEEWKTMHPTPAGGGGH